MTDSVWSNKRLLYFLLPEADREDAEGFLARIEHVTALTAHGDAQIAVFPDDGLTKDALLVAATVPCEDPKATIAGAAAERAVRSRRGLRHLVAAAATAVGSSAERAAGSAEEA
jgi:hypothetical protein